MTLIIHLCTLANVVFFDIIMGNLARFSWTEDQGGDAVTDCRVAIVCL